MEPLMAGALDDWDFRRRMERVETLVHEIERCPDAAARANARELVQAVLDLHGAGLTRIFEQITSRGETGLALVGVLARDDLVGSLLLLHGLHPLDLETRVRQALDKIRPYVRSHGGDVELLGVEGGVVRLRMAGSGQGCPSSNSTVKSIIEEAIHELAPDAEVIEVEGAAAPAARSSSTFVPLETLRVGSGR
jgi:Fe-S cluster biogenesis protein NfuA